jgi:hypothetical protein
MCFLPGYSYRCKRVPYFNLWQCECFSCVQLFIAVSLKACRISCGHHFCRYCLDRHRYCEGENPNSEQNQRKQKCFVCDAKINEVQNLPEIDKEIDFLYSRLGVRERLNRAAAKARRRRQAEDWNQNKKDRSRSPSSVSNTHQERQNSANYQSPAVSSSRRDLRTGSNLFQQRSGSEYLLFAPIRSRGLQPERQRSYPDITNGTERISLQDATGATLRNLHRTAHRLRSYPGASLYFADIEPEPEQTDPSRSSSEEDMGPLDDPQDVPPSFYEFMSRSADETATEPILQGRSVASTERTPSSVIIHETFTFHRTRVVNPSAPEVADDLGLNFIHRYPVNEENRQQNDIIRPSSEEFETIEDNSRYVHASSSTTQPRSRRRPFHHNTFAYYQASPTPQDYEALGPSTAPFQPYDWTQNQNDPTPTINYSYRNPHPVYGPRPPSPRPAGPVPILPRHGVGGYFSTPENIHPSPWSSPTPYTHSQHNFGYEDMLSGGDNTVNYSSPFSPGYSIPGRLTVVPLVVPIDPSPAPTTGGGLHLNYPGASYDSSHNFGYYGGEGQEDDDDDDDGDDSDLDWLGRRNDIGNSNASPFHHHHHNAHQGIDLNINLNIDYGTDNSHSGLYNGNAEEDDEDRNENVLESFLSRNRRDGNNSNNAPGQSPSNVNNPTRGRLSCSNNPSSQVSSNLGIDSGNSNDNGFCTGMNTTGVYETTLPGRDAEEDLSFEEFGPGLRITEEIIGFHR